MLSFSRPRILLLIPHLGGGGSEHVVETLTRSLSPAKYDIHLALITTPRSTHLPFHPSVSVHQLRATRVRGASIKLLRLVWRLKPHLIFSGIAHLNLLVLALRPLIPRSTRIVVRQNGALPATLAPHPRILSRRLYSHSYRRADRVICQTASMAHEIHRGLDVHPSNLLVLPNPTNIRRIRQSSPPPPERTATAPTLLSVGRLVPEKGFDILLEAFANVSAPLRSAKLIIAGTGPELPRLQSQARALGLTNRVLFAGQVADPVIQFQHASLFVLSSRSEGLPNALLEAAAAGLPIVATPASSGVVDLLEDREGIWLAKEVSADALRAALESALNSIRPAARYQHSWVDAYDLSCAIPAYEAAMDQLIAEPVS